MIKKILVFIFIFLSVNRMFYLNAQNNTSEANEILGEDIVSALKRIDEKRIKEQSKILCLNDLQGTFWVSTETYKIGNLSYFDGYIFINNNCVLFIRGISHQTDALKDLSISPTLYITMVIGAMTYNINEDKIIYMDKTYFYLEDTVLYVLRDGEYRKLRLEDRFSIWK